MDHKRGHTGSRTFDPVRLAAVEALSMIEQGDQTDIAVQRVITNKGFRPIDIRFLLQLINGTTKMKRRLDHEMKFYLARPATELPIRLLNIMRLGFYQLRFTDRVPPAAAVSESVNLAHHLTDKSRASLVNAVLRTVLREPNKVRFVSKDDNPVKYLADFYSFPEHFVAYCLQEFKYEATEQLLQRYNLPPHVTYRVNFLKAKPEEVTQILTDAEIKWSVGKYLPEFIHIEESGLPLERELIATGKVFVQDESAGLPVRLLNPKQGDIMVDLTSAPGGKATYAAIRMRNKGRVTAVDKSRSRLQTVVDNAKTLGIKIIAPVASDMLDFESEPFDRVLLDPPCSGWGTAGKHSDLRWSKSAEDIVNLTRIQKVMIEKAAKLVRPGGVMVYSTCTIMRDENDQIVEEFLAKNRDFEIDSAAEFYPPEIVSSRGFVKTYPNVGSLDGAFCARLKRRPN